MIITATELKRNLGKYLDMVGKENLLVTRNGKPVAKLVNPQVSAVDAIRGILKDAPKDLDMHSFLEERVSE